MRNQDGVTTVELLSTIVIVVIILSGILSAYSAVQKTSALNGQKYIASMIAVNQMEEKRYSLLKGTTSNTQSQVTEKGIVYTYNVSVSEIESTRSGISKIFLIKSTVTWENGAHSVETNSYLTTR